MDGASLSKCLHGNVAKQKSKIASFGEDAEFDGFPSSMADSQSIKNNKVYSFPPEKQHELFVMCLSWILTPMEEVLSPDLGKFVLPNSELSLVWELIFVFIAINVLSLKKN